MKMCTETTLRTEFALGWFDFPVARASHGVPAGVVVFKALDLVGCEALIWTYTTPWAAGSFSALRES